ncbi:hypothetical protein SDC9_202621 [bioreactor metagenome]|uniref:Uncharacterized protein n=1 Tax=bioreactor metagenome TaxID=1076179 RepID=A0A645IVR1_9ZZZZ
MPAYFLDSVKPKSLGHRVGAGTDIAFNGMGQGVNPCCRCDRGRKPHKHGRVAQGHCRRAFYIITIDLFMGLRIGDNPAGRDLTACPSRCRHCDQRTGVAGIGIRKLDRPKVVRLMPDHARNGL